MADEVPTVVVTDTPVLPPAPAPKPVDQSKPPVLGPLLGLLSSQKALMMILVLIGSFVALLMDKITWVQFGIFVGPLIGVWTASHALQDGLGGMSKSKPEQP